MHNLVVKLFLLSYYPPYLPLKIRAFVNYQQFIHNLWITFKNSIYSLSTAVENPVEALDNMKKKTAGNYFPLPTVKSFLYVRFMHNLTMLKLCPAKDRYTNPNKGKGDSVRKGKFLAIHKNTNAHTQGRRNVLHKTNHI